MGRDGPADAYFVHALGCIWIAIELTENLDYGRVFPHPAAFQRLGDKLFNVFQRLGDKRFTRPSWWQTFKA